MSWRPILVLTLLLSISAASAAPALAQDTCPGNLAANASIEEGSRGTAALGTRPSAVVANAWIPWSVWGYSAHSREAEFEVEDISRLGRYSTYRVHTGQFSQKFSTTFGVHNAGFYQRIAVPQGSSVTFSMWVQVYTGQEQLRSDSVKDYVSDLSAPGNYRVYVGIDPFGDEPTGFGAPPSERTVWSDPVLDRETRRHDEAGLPYDAWVQIEVTVQAESEHITVYTRGEPEFPVRVNVSYWDDACLTAIAPTPAPSPTSEFTPTPEPSPSPTSTRTALPSATPTEAPPATPTLEPTETEIPTPTAPPPTATPIPAASATATSEPTPRPPAPARDTTDNPLLLLLFGALWLAAAGLLGWSLWQRQQAGKSEGQQY
jgi:hypothetical protein